MICAIPPMVISLVLSIVGSLALLVNLQNDIFQNDMQQQNNSLYREKRVVNGFPVSIESFPWTVLILNKGRCGGVLIDKQWVLTAGHCIVNRNIVVYFGIDRISTTLTYSSSKHIKRNVIEIYKPRKNLFTTSDLALLKLSQPITISSSIRPILLNQKNRITLINEQKNIDNYNNNYNNNGIKMAGFGRNNYLRNDHLLAGYFYLKPIFTFTSIDILTAKSKYNSPCYGDSGSGLIIERDNNSYLIGITSSILAANCEPNNLAFFTDVSFYYKWIIDKIGIDSQRQQQQQQDDQENDIDNDIDNDYNSDNIPDEKFIHPPIIVPPPVPSIPEPSNIPQPPSSIPEPSNIQPPPSIPEPSIIPFKPNNNNGNKSSIDNCWPSFNIPWINYKILLCNQWNEFIRIMNNNNNNNNDNHKSNQTTTTIITKM